ncbi:MAG: MauE/DoxX family redox-associated membrane protein, partial [Vicinamibacterales bacterium]
MTLLAEAVNVVLAVVLLWAGLEKARAVASFVSALRKLRAPPVAAPVLAWIVIAIELSAGLGLVYGPSVIALAAVTALAIAFAGAGLIALRRGQRIPCHCFGTYGPRALGRDQHITFPLWIAGDANVWS